MTSQDVIHSFYIPAFRMKQDVLPGRYTVEWFRATKPGTYHLFCAEYCGTQHSGMVGYIVVQEPAQYEAWMNGGSSGPLFGHAARKSSPNWAASPAIAPTRRAAGPTCREFSASRCNSKMDAPLPPTRIIVRECILDPGAKRRQRIPADHADVSGPGQRRTGECAGRLYQIDLRRQAGGRRQDQPRSTAPQAQNTANGSQVQ